MHRGNQAVLKYLQIWAGVTRTGYHGIRVDGQEPGRFEEAGLIVTSWLQGTSRDGDPQDHIHNQIARITRTVRDGKWRAQDTASLRAVLGALQGVAATAVECELKREFGAGAGQFATRRGLGLSRQQSGCTRRFKSSSLAGQPVLVLSRRAIDHVGLGAMLAGWRHVTGGQRTKGTVTGVQLLVGLSWGLPG